MILKVQSFILCHWWSKFICSGPETSIRSVEARTSAPSAKTSHLRSLTEVTSGLLQLPHLILEAFKLGLAGYTHDQISKWPELAAARLRPAHVTGPIPGARPILSATYDPT